MCCQVSAHQHGQRGLRLMYDQERQRMLLSEGLHVGKGEAHGISTSCLADYLLQLLMCHGVISNGPFDTANAEKLWRRDT